MVVIKVISVDFCDFQDKDGKQVKYSKVYFKDDNDKMAYFTTSKNVKQGDTCSCKLVNVNGNFKLKF